MNKRSIIYLIKKIPEMPPGEGGNNHTKKIRGGGRVLCKGYQRKRKGEYSLIAYLFTWHKPVSQLKQLNQIVE